MVDAQPREVFRVAGPSIWPFVAAVGLILVFAAEIFSLRPRVLGGAAILVVALVGWHWPDRVATGPRELEFEREHDIVVWPNGSPTVNRWAMSLLILLVAIGLGNLLFSYFYIRLENPVWPPDNIPLPGLVIPGVATVLMLAGALAMRWAHGRINRDDRRGLRIGLAAAFVLGALATGLVAYDLWQLDYDHTFNAYSSIFFTLGWFLLLMVGAGLGQNLFTQAWAWRGRYSGREHVAVEVGALYWYASALLWLIAAATMYLAPYFV
jgi:cytochrome c oxidase subunit I+III